MISIHDVAKKSGVAKSTVSKVLNNYPHVSEATKKMVQDGAKELGYVPNSVAVSLSKKNFNRIALIIDSRKKSPYIDEICMQYLSSAFHEAGAYHIDVMTLFSVQFADMDDDEIITFLKSERINCMIIFGLLPDNQRLYQAIKPHDFYVVLVDSNIHGPKVSSVSINFRQAQYDVAKLTYKNSEYQNTALFLTGPNNSYAMEQKWLAIRQLQKEYGFKLIAKNVNYSELEARNVVLRFGKKCDMIFCASDVMAISAVLALIELDVFRHVSGFDGLKLTGYTRVEVSTVKQNFALIAERAFQELMRLLDGHNGRYVELPYEIDSVNYVDIIE